MAGRAAGLGSALLLGIWTESFAAEQTAGRAASRLCNRMSLVEKDYLGSMSDGVVMKTRGQASSPHLEINLHQMTFLGLRSVPIIDVYNVQTLEISQSRQWEISDPQR